MTLEEIGKLKIEDVSEILGQRLLIKDLPVTSENLETELTLYKEELTDLENLRLKKESYELRWNTLKVKDSGLPSFRLLYPSIPNAKKKFKELLEDPSKHEELDSLLNQLEAKDSELELEKEAKKKEKEVKDKELAEVKKNIVSAIDSSDLDISIKTFLKFLADKELKKY